MTAILIADTFKSSIVMTSEIFKDKILGVSIDIVKTGQECLEKLENQDFDMIVIDFDLPDTDGVTLSKILRKEYGGPIIITAFPDKVVRNAIEKELFPYNDSLDWIKKPVAVETLNKLIQKYILEKKRVRKRYSTELDALISGKGAGRGKRAPKVKGNVINLSIGGALLNLENQLKMKPGEEISLTLYHAHKETKTKETAKKTKAKATVKKTKAKKVAPKKPEKTSSSRIKAKIAWSDKQKKQAGISFEGLTENNRKILEGLLRNSSELP